MKILKLALFLAVVAGLSGAALSSVYEMTDPVIQEAKIASEKENLVKIYTSGEEFKAVETNLSDYPALQAVYEASSGGSVKGYVYKCSVTGYGGASTPIVYLIALDKDGTYKVMKLLMPVVKQMALVQKLKINHLKMVSLVRILAIVLIQ